LPHKKNVAIEALLYALLATLIWSGNYTISKAVNNIIPPIHLAFYRWTLAACIITCIGYKSLVQHWYLIKKRILFLIVSSIIGVSTYNTLIYYGAHTSTPMNLSLIGATSPFTTFMLAAIFLKEKLSWQKILGLCICFTGVLILLSKGNINIMAGLSITKGDAWMMLASVLWAVYTILLRIRPQEISLMAFQTTTFILGALFLLPAYLIEERYVGSFSLLANANNLIVFAIIYTAIGASIIAFFSWSKVVQLVGPSKAILFLNLIPIFASVESQFILKLPIEPYHYITLGLIALGLIIANISVAKNNTLRA
jgi:drug/metabolite transporter (DMT)-like permease